MPASLVNARTASPCELDPMARAAFENSSSATFALTGSPAGSFDSTGTLAAAGAILGILKGSRRGSANTSVGGGGGGVSTTASRARARAFVPGLAFRAFGRICFLCLSSIPARVSSSSSSSSSSVGTTGVPCSGEESSPRPSSAIEAVSMFMTSATKASTSLAPTSFPRGPCLTRDRRMDSRTISLSSDSSRGSSTRRRLIEGPVDGDWSSSSPSFRAFSSPGRMVATLSVSFFIEPNFCDSRGHAYPR